MRWECRERFSRHRLQRKPLVSDPDMYHGTCVTHVPWYMSGSLSRGGGGKRSRCVRNPQFYASGKRPIPPNYNWTWAANSIDSFILFFFYLERTSLLSGRKSRKISFAYVFILFDESSWYFYFVYSAECSNMTAKHIFAWWISGGLCLFFRALVANDLLDVW